LLYCSIHPNYLKFIYLCEKIKMEEPLLNKIQNKNSKQPTLFENFVSLQPILKY